MKMKRYAFSFVMVIMAALCAMSGAYAQVGELVIGGVNNSSQQVPIYGTRATDEAYHSQFVYPADSLTSVVDKLIVGLDFYTKNVAAEPFDSRYEVRLGSYEYGEFGSSALIDNENFTKVYEGTLDATGEVMSLTFERPYDYRGGNLIVDVRITEVGTVSGECTFRGSPRTGSAVMRCTGIAGRYPFMPRVNIKYTDLPATTRTASHLSAVELCHGSTGTYYDWHLTLERGGGVNYDTVIYKVNMKQYSFLGSDTTVEVEHVMPRDLLGCADTERITITIYRPLMHYVYDTVCQGTGNYTDYGLNIDLTGMTAGTRNYLTAETEWGRVYDVQCFDTTYLQLTVNRTYKMSRNLKICTARVKEDEGGLYYMYGDHRIDIPGPLGSGVLEMTDTLFGQTVKGCDSTLVLNISVCPSDRSDTTVYVRESELPYTIMDVTFTYATTRSRMFYNQYNCDSIVGITVALKPSYRDTTYVVGCGAYEWTVMGTPVATIDHDTLASYVMTSSDELDSVLYLKYTTGTINRADTLVTACETYTFKGVEYTASTNIYDTVPGVGMDCDTQYMWKVRINHPIYRSETAEVCDSLMWNGTVYRESTTDIYYYRENECENADTLHLSVIYSTIGDTTVYAPQSFIYYDTTYTATGDYVYIIENQIGCDSIVTLHLFVTPRGTPMPQLYAYEKNVLILNHYPYGDNTRVDYDSVYWELNGSVIEGFHGDSYHLENYGTLSGCYKVWVLIEGTWFPTNEICIGNGIGDVADDVDYNVWPNPVRKGESVNIAINGQETEFGQWTAVIYDLEGRTVVEKKIEPTTVMRCNMKPGTYIVNIMDGASKNMGKGKKIIVTD